MRFLLLLIWLIATRSAVASPTAEFEAPYAIRVMPGGAVVEVSGSFSWAVPQNLMATLASAPGVRTVRLDSPGPPCTLDFVFVPGSDDDRRR